MNLDGIFMHENHTYPQSLSDHGNLRVNNTSHSVACLEDFNTPVSDPSPEHSVTRSSTRKRRRKGMRRMFLHVDNTG